MCSSRSPVNLVPLKKSHSIPGFRSIQITDTASKKKDFLASRLLLGGLFFPTFKFV